LLTCEVCGSPIKTAPTSVEIDGAILQVCQNCARRGRPVTPVPGVHHPTSHHGMTRTIEPEMEVDPDYPTIVRVAREKLGLTQEALGRMINVKPSVISHIETGKMKPDMALARNLMHLLKIELLVPSSEFDSSAGQRRA